MFHQLINSIYTFFWGKNIQYRQVLQIYNNGYTYKYIVEPNESNIYIDITDNHMYQRTQSIETIEIIDSFGNEKDVTDELKRYFGPKGNHWKVNLYSLAFVTNKDIEYLTITTDNRRTYEYHISDIVKL